MLIPLVHGAILAGPSLYKLGSRLYDRARGKVAPRATGTASTLAAVSQNVVRAATPVVVGSVSAAPAAWARYRGARPELRGAPENTTLAYAGYRLLQPEDFDALFEVSEALGVPVDSIWTVIHHESGGDATALNPEPAAGLIQLTTYAKLAGYDTKDKIRAIIYQTAREQLRGVVRQHYERSAAVVRGMTPGELLLFNFTPKFVGKPEPTVIASRGEPIYDKNYKGFDVDGKGTITVGDVYRAAERMVAEAGGRRVTREGRIIQAPAGSGGSPAAAPVSAAPRPARTAPRPTPAAPASSTPADAPPDPVAFVSGLRGNVSSGAETVPASGASSAWDKALDFVAAQGAGGLLDKAKGAFSELTTGGGPIGPSTDPSGLLLAAAQAQLLDPVSWTWVAIPGEDLEVFVPNDAFKATLGDTPHVRIPLTYADLCALCRLLGCVPATRAIVDAVYQRASVHPKPVGLVHTDEDGLRMNTVGFVLKHHTQLEQQLRDFAAAQGRTALADDTLIEPVGKWWIIDPKLGTSSFGAHGAVNYGWFKTSVKDPIQTPGGRHNDVHCDYSQIARVVHRYGRRSSTGADVDLCDVYASKWPDLVKFIDVFR